MTLHTFASGRRELDDQSEVDMLTQDTLRAVYVTFYFEPKRKAPLIMPRRLRVPPSIPEPVAIPGFVLSSPNPVPCVEAGLSDPECPVTLPTCGISTTK